MPDRIYIRPVRLRQYISTHKHQINSRNVHSKWLNFNIEIKVFDNADFGSVNAVLAGATDARSANEWSDGEGNLWGLSVTNGSIDYIGSANEQFGFFRNPQNVNREWHGYPIIPFSNKRGEHGEDISEELLETWINDPSVPIFSEDIATIKRRKSI